MTIDDSHLLNYDDLTAAERDAVDVHLAEHPNAAELVAEGRALRAVLKDAARAGAKVPDAEAVAHYLVAQHMGHRPLPPDIVALGERVEVALAAHPELERQVSIMRERLAMLTRSAEAPRAQFERLTGRRLGRSGGQDVPTDVQRSSPPLPADDHRDRSRGWRTSVVDRDAVPLLRRVSPRRLAAAAVLVVAFLYGSLFLAGRAGESPYARLADLDAVDTEFVGLRLRGADGQVDVAADRYAEALDALHKAHDTTLGLFPHYNADGLARAARLFDEVTELQPLDGALGLEARFLFGRVALYQGDLDTARSAFQIVVDREGPSAPDAQRLLDLLDPARPS